MSRGTLPLQEQGIDLDQEGVAELIGPEVESFCGKSDGYDHTFRESYRAGLEGVENIFMLPATQFMFGATLRVLNDDQVQDQLPNEVKSRYQVAASVADSVAEVGVGQGVFTSAYEGTDLYGLADAEALSHLSNHETLRHDGSAIFADSYPVAGGALQWLVERDRSVVEGVPIIKKSLGLLVVSRLKANEANFIVAGLLGTPYVDPKHLEIPENDSGEKMRFTPEILEKLKRYFGENGCPAGKLRAHQSRGTLLTAAWPNIVDYLLPPQATADLPRLI